MNDFNKFINFFSGLLTREEFDEELCYDEHCPTGNYISWRGFNFLFANDLTYVGYTVWDEERMETKIIGESECSIFRI